MVEEDKYFYPDEYHCIVFEKMQKMLRGAIGRSNHRGWECDLDLDHMSTLYVEICPILGIDMQWENKGRHVHGSPSLDRIDNKVGYKKGNVQIISHRANALKKDYLLVEWNKMASYMESGGDKFVLTEQHYKEPIEKVLSKKVIRDIKVERRNGFSAEDIACMLDIPFSQVCRYLIQIEGV
jgi:hypothetical protein